MLIPVYLDVPESLVPQLEKGQLEIVSAVVRNTTNGRIYKYVKIIAKSAQEKVAQASARDIGLVLLGAGTATLVAGAVYKFTSKRNAKREAEAIECGVRFHNALLTYLAETSKGELNEGTIDELIESIHIIQAKQKKRISISFSKKELIELLQQIHDYTEAVTVAMDLSPDSIPIPRNKQKDNLIILEDYLLRQKSVLQTA